MQEVHRRLLDQHVVVVGGAAHERADAGDESLTLKPMPVGEEALGGGRVGGAEHDVTELARRDRAFADDARCAPVRRGRAPGAL